MEQKRFVFNIDTAEVTDKTKRLPKVTYAHLEELYRWLQKEKSKQGEALFDAIFSEIYDGSK